MRPSTLICATCCIVASTMNANAQNQYTEYLGAIKTSPQPMAIAVDSDGRLLYGTFNAGSSGLLMIEDPEAATGSETDFSTTVTLFPAFPAGRGVQTLSVSDNDNVFIGGDTNDTASANIWKIDKVAGPPVTYQEDTAFTAAASAASPSRRSGVAVLSNANDGLIAANAFQAVHFFNFSGALVGSSLSAPTPYMREVVFNSTDNVLYGIRNGNNSNNLIDYYWTGVSPVTGGGTLVTETLIDDGASNSAFGTSAQNGFYYADQNQLVTLDGSVIIASERIQPEVRVWNLSDNGTSVSLAYSIDGISETEKFQNLGDAMIYNERLYIDAPSSSTIFVFGLPGSRVSDWKEY